MVTPRSTRPLRHPISKLHFLHIPRRPRRSRTSSSATYVYGGSVARVPQRLCARGASAAPKTGPRSSGHFPLSTTDVLLAHHPNHSHHQHSEPLALIGANRAPPALCKRTMRTRILSASAHAAHCRHCMAGRQGPTDAVHTELQCIPSLAMLEKLIVPSGGHQRRTRCGPSLHAWYRNFHGRKVGVTMVSCAEWSGACMGV